MSAATGLDLAAIIQGQAVGRGFGAGVAQVTDAQPAASTRRSRSAAPGTAVIQQTHAESTENDPGPGDAPEPTTGV